MRLDTAPQVPPALREAYLASLIEAQEHVVEALVQTGRCVLIRDTRDEVVGYALVADSTVVEFFVVAASASVMRSAFELVLDECAVGAALCKSESFDHSMVAAAAARPATVTAVGFLFRTIIDRGFTPNPRLRVRQGTDDDIEAVWSMHDGFFADHDEIRRYAATAGLLLYENTNDELVGVGGRRPGCDRSRRSRHRHGGRHESSWRWNRNADHRSSQSPVACRSATAPCAAVVADNLASRRTLERAGFVATHSLLSFAY